MTYQYIAVAEDALDGSWSAYVPDLPGCISTGDTRTEVGQNIREAIAFHIEGLLEEDLPVPTPSSEVELVDVA